MRSAGSRSSRRDAQRARVDAVGGGRVVERHVAPAALLRMRAPTSSVRYRMRRPDLDGCVPSVATSPTTPKSTARCRRSRRRRCRPARPSCRADQLAVPHRPHVQRAAPADDQVGAADQLGRQRRGEAAGDVERPPVVVEQPLRGGARREQRARCAPPVPRSASRASVTRRPVRRRTPDAATPTSTRRQRVDLGRHPAPRRRGHRVRRTDGSRSPASSACTASGRFSSTVRRPRSARVVRGDGRRDCVGGDFDAHRHRTDRRRPAPPGRRRSSTAARSPRRRCTIIGVRLLAASVIPVIALVSPQPWCTVSAATRPLVPRVARRPSSPRRPRAGRRRSVRPRRSARW